MSKTINVMKTAPVSKPSEVFEYSGQGPWFTVFANGEMPARMAKEGIAGPKTPATTLPALLQKCAEKHGQKDALLVEKGLPKWSSGPVPPALPRESWTKWTFADYLSDVKLVAKGMIALGLQPFDSVNIWGFNSPQWFIGALASMFAGGKSGGLYPTDTPDTAAFKVVHSAGSIILVDEQSKLDKLLPALNARGDCTRVKAVVCWLAEPADGATVEIKGCGQVPLLSWDKLLKMGSGSDLDAELETRVANVKPGHCAGLIYTSGTTGDPKAVMISHDNIIYLSSVANTCVAQSSGFGMSDEEERVLSYLPLSHVAGLMLDITAQLSLGAFFPGRIAVFFARIYDLKANSIKDRLGVAKPTIFLGVPLVWEKMADKIRAIGASTGACVQKISGYCKANMGAYAKSIQLGGTAGSPGCLAPKVLTKVKVGVGLDQCKFALTGAAPIRADTLEYYGSLGIFINELYGMSECTGATTVSTNEAHQWGSCGYAMPGTEVKIFIVDSKDFNKKTECPRAPELSAQEEKYQGEICFRGRHIMMGYLACKDMGDAHIAEITKKNEETIDTDGWLHSGDKGLMSEKGMIKITGRYKELIIGEGGENIAPVPIEDSVKKLCDGIAECMMIGDQRKYNVAFITLKAVGANGENPGTDKLDAAAARLSPNSKLISEAMKDQAWIQTLTDAINTTNKDGKVVPNNAFKIQKFTILPTNFSEEGNELTPTKKLKRKVVEKAYAELIDRMYATEGTYIPYNP